MGKLLDITGQRFGRLVAISRDVRHKPSGKRNYYWVCDCDCGTRKAVPLSNLRNGMTKSCGCLRVDLLRKKFAESGGPSWKGGAKNRGSEAYMEAKLTASRNNSRRNGYEPCTATAAQLQEAYEVCGASCQGCGVHADKLRRGLYLDHCHTTGKFRAFLCSSCNKILGFALDDPKVLRTLADIVETT